MEGCLRRAGAREGGAEPVFGGGVCAEWLG